LPATKTEVVAETPAAQPDKGSGAGANMAAGLAMPADSPTEKQVTSAGLHQPTEPASELFVPLRELRQVLRYWWLVSLFCVIGGLAGLLISALRPPVYEAVVHFSASIDYTSTGPLTQYEEDMAINVVGDIIYSIDVKNEVLDRAQAEGLTVTLRQLNEDAYIERRVTDYNLRVRHADPAVAHRVAELWAGAGYSALMESYRHSIQAEYLNRYILTLTNCLSRSVGSEPAHGLCANYRLVEIQEDIQAAGQALFEERKASRGLFAGVTIGPAAQAVLNHRPIQFDRNQLVLFGGLIGLLLGIVLVETGLPARLGRRS
jgi:hypothetical protein